jgi:hypothetical protein
MKKKIWSINRTGLLKKADAMAQLRTRKTVDHNAGWYKEDSREHQKYAR